MAKGSTLSFRGGSPAKSHSYGRLTNSIGRSLTDLLSRMRAIGHPWWELDDYLLADIGKSRGDAEIEKLRHRLTIRDPRDPLAPDLRVLGPLPWCRWPAQRTMD